MATREPRILKDGLLSALAGMDSGRDPSIIEDNQVSYAHNVTMRGGFINSRPGFLECTLIFEDTEQEDWFTDQPFQGAGTYIDTNHERSIVSVVSGRVFLIRPSRKYQVHEITPTFITALNGAWDTVGDTVMSFVVDASDRIYAGYPIWVAGNKFLVSTVTHSTKTITVTRVSGTDTVFADNSAVSASDPNIPGAKMAWLCQADEWLIVQDGQSAPILYDGSISRRAIYQTTKPEVPAGRSMTYNNGRLWVQVGDHDVAAGDIFGGPTEVICFSEDQYLAEGGRFHMEQIITGLFSSTNNDTSTGQGPVLIFAENRIYSINVPPLRDLWKNLTYPIQTVLVAHGGTTAGYSIVQVNSDVFYMSNDGVRSLALSKREYGEWGLVPVSGEMDRVLQEQNDTLTYRTSAIVLDNRLLFTIAPTYTCQGVVHRGLIALDFSTVSRMGTKAPPAWDGLWTGLLPTLLVAGCFDSQERGYAFCLNADSENELWEIRSDYHFDNNNIRIQSFIETKSLSFKTPLELKRLMALELWVGGVEGTVDFDLRWRPDQTPCWNAWGTKQISVTHQACSWTCGDLETFKPGYRTRLGFGQPADSCETFDNKPARDGFEHQIRLAWTGKCQLRKILLKAQIVEELPMAICDTD